MDAGRSRWNDRLKSSNRLWTMLDGRGTRWSWGARTLPPPFRTANALGRQFPLGFDLLAFIAASNRRSAIKDLRDRITRRGGGGRCRKKWAGRSGR
jgi:hypothetical protein